VTAPVAIVLAGGAARRFWPLKDKLLLEFAGRSLLELHLDALREQGWRRLVVVCGPDARERVDQIVARKPDLEANVVVQAEPLGMADALLSAGPVLDRLAAASVYVTQAHDLVAPELHGRMLAEWGRRGDGLAGLIAAASVTSYFPGGYLRLDGNRVTAVVEKPGAGNEPSNLVTIVAHVIGDWPALRDRLVAAAAAGDRDDAYERALSALMPEQEFRPVRYEGRWRALKYPWQLLDVMEELLARWTANPELLGAGYVLREDGVLVGQDVRVFPGGQVAAPALIGHGSVIGNNALVRGSIVGPNCVVGFGSEVARSYLGAGVQLHHNYVGDSVLGDRSLLGWGVTTANFRLDGRSVPSLVGGERLDTGREKLGLILGAGSKIGVNTSTMPGVKIGAGALVGPNLSVTRDVEDGARLLEGARGRV
jgi:bifunctional UDP-N-acetylglucosamine pyrophosphorylase/glucosamine-1-phosphate N-acetyltransferase